MASLRSCTTWWLVGLVAVGMTSSASVRGGQPQCKCVPDQWQGVLASLEREFDLEGGRSGSSESNLFVSYDYENGKFAMTDLKTGNRAVADYIKGYKYVMRNEGCRGILTEEKMRQMCLPDHAEYLGEYTLGTESPVDIWQFSGPYNVSLKTNVIQKDCVPISEEIYTAKGTYASLQSSLYLDVTLGIKDRSVFDVPIDCMLEAMEGPQQYHHQTKRSSSEDPWSLVDLLKEEGEDTL